MMKRIVGVLLISLLSLFCLALPLVIQKDDGEPGSGGGVTLYPRERVTVGILVTCYCSEHNLIRTWHKIGTNCPEGGVQSCRVVNANSFSCEDLLPFGHTCH